MSDLVSFLFKTNALRVSPADKPFWYTSGKIGPFYINTHFLYGSEQDAVDLLSFIDSEKENRESLPKKVFERTNEQYNKNEIYRHVIDEMLDFINTNFDLSDIDYVSGGERRDWFFSNIIANKLNKPHICIYKDLSTVLTDSNFEKILDISQIKNSKVLHVADLITEASSYVRAWIPAIQNLGATITTTLVVVDRLQGGKETLFEKNIAAFSLLNIDESLFEKALELNIITKDQFDMLLKFKANPDETMRNFLASHPNFLQDALKADAKTAQKAQLCIDKNLYNL